MKYVNIDLTVKKRGFRRFISSWLVRDEKKDRTYLVDTGPASTWPIVQNAVKTHGGGRVDAVLLTHVHLDHAGGAGLAVSEYGARIAAAPRGVPHLLEPSALWKGSVDTLGDTAFLYGEPVPVPGDSLFAPGMLPEGFSSIDTPGHASHHQSFILDEGNGERVLFAGEAAGIFLEGEEPFPYLRPATPPRFFPDVTLDSIERLMKADCRRICYSHFGAADGAKDMLRLAKDQILFWKDVVIALFRKGVSPADEETIFLELLERDPFLAAWRNLESDIRDREREFIGNSIRGFCGAFGAEK